MTRRIAVLLCLGVFAACQPGANAPEQKYRLITLDPGHFHAALVQKTMYPNVAALVHVYAPDGDDVDLHMRRIDGFNLRAESPTRWETEVYRGDDYLQKMLDDKAGDIVVISGNNSRKTDYILKALQAGLNVYADKPMATNAAQFQMLEQAVQLAGEKDLLLLDIMTERFEITTILQKEISRIPDIFGVQLKGSVENPGITKESVHHFFKDVAGKPLQRPAWFFDAAQAGDGLVDVTTHLVDLVQWECFPDEIIDYRKDVQVDSASRWPTTMSLQQFTDVTQVEALPAYLDANFRDDKLYVYANGEINYRIRGVHARVRVGWEYQAPDGAGDTHYSEMRGSRANLIIRQGQAEAYVPELYIEPVAESPPDAAAVRAALQPLFDRYPGLGVTESEQGWRLTIPDQFRSGHEAHFAEVTEAYLRYLANGELPAWEWPNILAKYYVTTTALELAKTR